MNISALNRSVPGVAAPAAADPASRTGNANLGVPSGSQGGVTKVSLGGGDSASGEPLGLVWENRSHSTAAAMMAHNIGNQPLAGRLQGLGGELLRQVAYDGKDFSQTVTAVPATAQNSTYDLLVAPNQASQHGKGDNQISLTLTTSSGTKVSLSLDASDKSIAIEAHSDGGLSESDRKALGKLADAFQKAIDGLSSDSPRIDLSALIQYDRNAFSAVDLTGQVKLGDGEKQSLEFHATSASRSISFNGPAGAGHVSVDLSQPASWGNDKQHAKALNHTLQQIDQAGTRGQANASALGLFKDAFKEINSDYGTPPAPQQQGIQLSDQDRVLTTGLADYEASFTQAESAPNPARESEKDSFSYQVSQTTQIGGHSQLDRTISQQQQSHLQARYHAPVSADAKLALDLSPASQNYKYITIDDSASSNASIAYDDGKLKSATLDQQASQKSRELKYVFGKLVSDQSTPHARQYSVDLTPLLAPQQTEAALPTLAQTQRGQLLASLSDRILLQASPDALPRLAN